MALFGLGKKPGLGIDIATDAVKAVELLANGDSYDVVSIAETSLPKNLITDDEITDIEKLSKMITQVRKKIGSTRVTVAAVSGNQAISKQVPMNLDLDDEAIAEKIESEAEALIPFPINEVRYDFESLGEHPKLPGQQRVLVTATRTVSVDTRVQALEGAGFKVSIMDVDNQAIARACNHLLPHTYPEVLTSKLPYIVLDISQFAMQAIVIADGEVIFNRIQAGGLVPLLSALDENGELDHTEILAKLRAGDVDEFPSLVIQDFLSDLWSQVSRSVQMYQSNATEKGFSAMLLTNSGAMLPMLAEAIADYVDYPVHVLNPFDHFILPNKLSHLQSHGPQFVEATGLALRSFATWHM